MMNAHHLQLIQLGNSILQSSRNELAVSLRFLDMALSALPYEMNLSTKFVATDGMKILFNPKYLSDLYQSDRVLINRLYLHILLHCVFRHVINQDDRDSEYWNIACDIAVEALIDSLQCKAVNLTVSDIREELYHKLKADMKVLTAEGIYRKLIAMELSEQNKQRIAKEFFEDDHQFWNGDDGQGDESQDDKQNDSQNEQQKEQARQDIQEKWQDISEKMGTNLETFEKDRGEEAGELLSYLSVENRQRYDYRRFLQRFVTWQEEIQIDDDAFDYVYYTYGLSHYKNMPLIEALEYKEVQKILELVIVIDTSESCKEGLAEAFVEETYSILMEQESFFRKMNVHIIQCDAVIQSHEVITSAEELEQYRSHFALRGAGGTDFRPAFDYVNQLLLEKRFQNLKGLIYFTDGYGLFPEKRPKYDVVFAFFKEDYTDAAVPPWAMKLILGAEDFPKLQ